MELRETVESLWKTNRERAGFREFKPVFARFSGALEEKEYNDVLAEIVKQAEAHRNQTILVEGPLPFHPNLQVLRQIKEELPGMDLSHIDEDDLIVFADRRINALYLNALNYVLALARRNHLFRDRRSMENFICNMIVFSLDLLQNLEFSDQSSCKLIQYGDLDERSAYFMILAHAMGLDVISLNPKRDPEVWKIDLDHLSTRKDLKYILSQKSLRERARAGHPFESHKTASSILADTLESELYGDTGVFRPWSFRQATNRSLHLQATLADVLASWNEDARFREGFEGNVRTQKITTPHFFFLLEGMDEEARDVLRTVLQSDPLLFRDGEELFGKEFPRSSRLRLAFRLKGDGTYDTNRLKTVENYPFESLNTESEERILAGINELIERSEQIFGSRLTKEEKIDLAADVFSLDPKILSQIESFDYPYRVPKIVFYLEEDRGLTARQARVLAFLALLGFDIAVFSPAGKASLSRRIRESFMSVFRARKLGNVRLEEAFASDEPQKKGGFSRFLEELFGS